MKLVGTVLRALAGSFVIAACHVYAGDEYPGTARAATPRQAAPPSSSMTPATQAPASPKITAIHLQSSAAPAQAVATVAASGATLPCIDNGVAAVPDCGALQTPDPSCAPTVFPQQKCNAYRAYLNPKVAAMAVSCMVELSRRQLCDGFPSYNCGRIALARACPDASVAQLCSIAATACKSIAGDCTALISGLNDQGKQQVAQCVAQGCGAGLASCVDGLTPGPNSKALTR